MVLNYKHMKISQNIAFITLISSVLPVSLLMSIDIYACMQMFLKYSFVISFMDHDCSTRRQIGRKKGHKSHAESC